MENKGSGITEQFLWESLRAIVISRGRPIHPAYRYPNWEAFSIAGKPWHNHGDPNFLNLHHGDRFRPLENMAETNRRMRHPSAGGRLADMDAMGHPGWRHFHTPQEESTITPIEESTTPELIPASARWKMLADAQGGYGATGITPSSPDSQIQAHLEGIARNGFKPPPGIKLA